MEANSLKAYLKKLNTKLEKIELKLSSIGIKEEHFDKWLDNDQVCQILRISKRTLQNYRDNGILPFSQFKDKILYKAEDIQNHLEKNYKKAF